MKLRDELQPKITPEMEGKYFGAFSKYARYIGNGIYSIGNNLNSTDVRELFLMYCAIQENIPFDTMN